MDLSALLQFTPLGGTAQAEQRSLAAVVGQQLQAYRAGLSLLAPTAPGTRRPEISLTYRIWGMGHSPQPSPTLGSYGAIADWFQSEGVDGRLLILGEPGMGKTHTLVAVGEVLLQRARGPGGALPVLIDLSGWAGEGLEAWLLSYLWVEYRICRATAKGWLEEARLTLLLDGFDHLSPERQRALARELDLVLRSRPNQRVMLCCRRRLLEATGINLSAIGRGVEIAPLAAQQVKDFVVAHHNSQLWQTIKASKALQPLARFPLYLSLLVLMAGSEGPSGAGITGRAALMQRFLQPHLAAASAPDRRALNWLADQLAGRSRQFRLDHLQRLWLPDSQRLAYRLLVGLGLAALMAGMGGNLGLGLAIGLVFSQVDLETFPYLALSLATAPGRGLAPLLLVTGIPALVLALGLGGLGAALFSPFNRGLAALGWAGLTGATLGWGLGLLALGWGGLPGAIQGRQGPTQDRQLALGNTLGLVGVLAGIWALVLVLPPLLRGQPPLTLLPPERLRLLLASLFCAWLWLSFTLQYALVRGLLALGSRWPPLSQPLLQRLVTQRILRSVNGSYWFSHEEVRQGLRNQGDRPQGQPEED
ncbi:MAG TPA: hypothetical protein IGR64_06900 [Leptolyngbyaceae cyanobacterium M65_K2018_010]|nr:hypothetical protein [Leptolyngbyaceae cyanobacterium M65_K2018_010]